MYLDCMAINDDDEDDNNDKNDKNINNDYHWEFYGHSLLFELQFRLSLPK